MNHSATRNTAAYFYTLTMDPLVWLEQEVTADDGVPDDYFGSTVALSGTTALVGTNIYEGNNSPGTVYVFTESGGAWTQAQKLTASNGREDDQFGYSVALDGTTALVGANCAPFQNYPPYDCGSGTAYLFTETNGVWNEARILRASNGYWISDFGSATALAGTTVLIGAPNSAGHDHLFTEGAAFFYGRSDLGLAVSAPGTVGQGENYLSQTIATNDASAASPAVAVTITVPAAASFVSATATQGHCNEHSGVVRCKFGSIGGNAGTATANVTLKAMGDVGDMIDNTASVAKATPPLSASAPTTITEAGICPEGYSEYDGTLNPHKRAHSPIYRAPAGVENAILTGPSGFQLYVVFQNARGRKVFRIPGNEVHRRGPAAYYTWVVKAGENNGAYTLCVLHP